MIKNIYAYDHIHAYDQISILIKVNINCQKYFY